MNKLKEKLTNTSIETLAIIVLVAIIIVLGIAIFSIATEKKVLDNFKKDSYSILSVAKNVYPKLEKTNQTSYIISSEDSTSKGVCITIDGLDKNGFLTKNYDKWDGYVIIEKGIDNEYTYRIWATNGKLLISGAELKNIKGLIQDDGITDYQDENLYKQVEDSFSTKDNKYYGKCITEKVE